jgi:hypothetical protein
MVICSAPRFARSSSMPNCCSIELTISSMPNESTTPLNVSTPLRLGTKGNPPAGIADESAIYPTALELRPLPGLETSTGSRKCDRAHTR